MARADILNILYAKKMNSLEFHFESLCAPPLETFLSPIDVQYLSSITRNPKLTSKPAQKAKMIRSFMETRNFRMLASGTNRICFKCFHNPNIVIKVAIDDVGRKDNPAEFRNQNILKPFVCKCFEISPDGEVGLFERVEPINTNEEFKSIAGDVFELLNRCIAGKYVLEDVGSNYFLNYGIRKGFGPVLLDYTYLYELDGRKLICNNKDPVSPTGYCMGEIDYDIGFNNLICEKCGKRYLAIDLKKDEKQNKLFIIKDNGGIPMKIIIKKGTEVIKEKEIGKNMKQADFVPGKKVTVVKPEIREANTTKIEIQDNTQVSENIETETKPETITIKPTYEDSNRRNRPAGRHDPDYFSNKSNRYDKKNKKKNKNRNYNDNTSIKNTPKVDSVYKNTEDKKEKIELSDTKDIKIQDQYDKKDITNPVKLAILNSPDYEVATFKKVDNVYDEY